MPTIAEAWFEEGFQQGLREGREAGWQAEIIIDVIDARFGRVPENLTERLSRMNDLVELRALLRRAATVASLEELAGEI